MVSSKHCTSKQALVRLWIHESMRVFHDRLIDDQDKTHFKGILTELVTKHLSSAVGPASELLPEDQSILFGDFLQPDLEPEDRVYQEVSLHCPTRAQPTCLHQRKHERNISLLCGSYWH